MLFSWRKNQQNPAPRPSARQESLLQKLRPSSSPASAPLISLSRVNLSPTIKDLSFNVGANTWLLLRGPNDFAKALFCDLCFSYIQPESGSVSPSMRGSDVSFLGRSNTTYGKSLIDHLSCGVRDDSRELLEFTVENVFTSNLKKLLSKDSPLLLKDNKKVADLDLNERDYMEIAEANLILLRRRAAIIDTTSDFYQLALEQGFRHSELLLRSGKTLFWILDDDRHIADAQAPWRNKAYRDIPQASLYFADESLVDHIN